MNNEQTQSPIMVQEEVGKILLTFPQAMQEVIKGNKITREEWEDENIYGMLKNETLMLFDKKDLVWIISEGDLIGEDWFVL